MLAARFGKRKPVSAEIEKLMEDWGEVDKAPLQEKLSSTTTDRDKWKERDVWRAQESDELERLARLLAEELTAIHAQYHDLANTLDHSPALQEWKKWEERNQNEPGNAPGRP